MKKPLNKRFSGFVKLGAGAVAAAAVIAAAARGGALSRGAVVSESLPSESIVITSAAQPTAVALAKPPTEPSAAVININTATAEELQALPGIGETKAAAIVEYRETHGEFTDISEITKVNGIGEAIFEQIRGKITTGAETSAPSNTPAGEPPTEPNAAVININTATAEELQALPGIGETKAAAIVEYRETHGEFTDISEITKVNGIGEAIFVQIRGKITTGAETSAPSNAPVGEPPTEPNAAVININTATAEELQALPGIGETKAAAIVEYRETHGEFTDISEITKVNGIGEAIFGQIRGKITTGAETSVPSNAPVSEPPTEPNAAVININTATAEELQALPGIGETKAAAIVEYRETHGAFTDISEITKVNGIGEAIFGQIRGKITTGAETSAPSNAPAGEPPTEPNAAVININTATAEELQALPGIGETKAAAIVEYRETHGEFTDISEIVNVSGIGKATFERIHDIISV